MWNIMLDKLPTDYNGYQIDSDFQTGIQILQALEDKELNKNERIYVALALLFKEEVPFEEACDGLEWFLTGWMHDKVNKKKSDQDVIATDYDVDQWRIYSAFRSQYNINLNKDKLHFWEFMALLTTLEECAYTRVVDIRIKKINPTDSSQVKKALTEAKEIYSLGKKEIELTDDQRLAADEFIKQMKRRT